MKYAVTLIALLIATPAFAGPHHKATHHPKVTLAKAEDLALAKVPGTIKANELEKENGRWIWSLEIKPTGEKRKLIKEVNIDADTGEIVEVDTERE